MAQAPVAPPQIENQPPPGQWTYEDYLNLPDDGRRYEIIDGVLYVTNAPDIDHQFTVMEIAGEMRQFVRTNGLGYVLAAPFEVHLSERSRPVQPDILFIKGERWPVGGAKFFEGAPDLVVEVLSPSSVRTDQVIKFNAYEQAGIAEYWIANPKARTLQVHTLSGGEYALVGEFAGDEVIRSVVLEGLAIVTSTLFNPVYQ
jgi:Uma2 family endonuclease